MEQPNDHDNLITLIADVKSLTKSQAEFHIEMRNRFDDLQNNYSGRLDRNEARIKVLEDWKIAQSEKAKDNKRYLQFLIAGMILLLGIILWHLTGYHI